MMNDKFHRTERFSVEGFFDGTWRLVMSSNDREVAIRGAGSVVVSRAFEHVRINVNGVVPGIGRELVRIDRHGKVRRDAFNADIKKSKSEYEEKSNKNRFKLCEYDASRN